MGPADALAVRLKFQLAQFRNAGAPVRRILVGAQQMNWLRTNRNPCDPPDFSEGYFCGVPVDEVHCYFNLVAYEF